MPKLYILPVKYVLYIYIYEKRESTNKIEQKCQKSQKVALETLLGYKLYSMRNEIPSINLAEDSPNSKQ